MYKLMHKLKLEMPAQWKSTSHTRTTVEQLKINKLITCGCSQRSSEKVFSVGDQTIAQHFP
jgi:hypothetical protein